MSNAPFFYKKNNILACNTAEMGIFEKSRRIIICNKRLFDKHPSPVEVRCPGSEALCTDWITLLFKQKCRLAHKCIVRKFNV